MIAKAKQSRKVLQDHVNLDNTTVIDKNQYLLNSKNPFAHDLSQYTIEIGNSTRIENSVQLKTWFYKDLNGKIYGPYTSLDMY